MEITIMINRFWKYLVKQFRRLFRMQAPVPAADAEALKTLYDLTSQSLVAYAVEATGYQRSIAGAKTNHKKDFYGKKFKKVKAKFQDELQRLLQVEQILKDNKIKMQKSTNKQLLEILETAKQGQK